jgi:ribosomal protein S18 acetylase RimI-like enzyme
MDDQTPTAMLHDRRIRLLDAASMDVELRTGDRIVVRPLLPDDKERLAAGFRRLSLGSRYRRFFSAIDALSARQLAYLTEIDYRDHFAWVALDGNAVIGVARYVRSAGDVDVAEAAVAVADDWHHRGVATALLGSLAAVAFRNGIRRFRCYVQADNRPVIDLLRSAHAFVTRDTGDILRADVAIPAPWQVVRGSPLYDALRVAASSGAVAAWMASVIIDRSRDAR